MNKAYERINWENYPSENTALNEENLNKMDAALNEVDNRVVTHETTKLDKATANSMVKDVDFDETTGIFTITFLNGVTKTLDTKLEKIATNFRYDYETQKLILTLVDETTQEIDMSALLTQYEFENSAYINWTVVNGKVKAEIINGSITADKLQPNFLADVTLQANSAKSSEQNAKVSEENAKKSEINAKNYADSAEPVASTAQGLNPTLDNSTGAPIISFKGDGATKQQTYSGKNLCPLGSVTGILKQDIPIDYLTDGQEYRLSCTLASTDTDTSLCAIYMYTNSETFMINAKRDARVSIKFTKETGGKFIRVYASNTYTNSVDDTVTVSDIQIELGDTATDYEIFVGGTASPNPDYPQEIYGVGESRNEFDLANSEWTKQNSASVITVEDNKLTITGPWFCKTVVEVEPNTDYYFSSKMTTDGPSTSGTIVVKDSTDTEYIYRNGTNFTFNSGGNSSVILLFYSSNSATSQTSTWENIQLEKGTTATPYKAFGAHSLSVKSTNKCIFGGLPFAQALVDSGSTNVVLDTDAKTVTYRHNTNYADKVRRVLFDKFKENTRYTFILKGTIVDNSASSNFVTTNLAVSYTDGTTDVFNLSNEGDFEYIFLSDNGKTISEFRYGYNVSDITTLNYEQCGIFEGVITADEFESYVETQADIPLSAPLYEGDYIRYNMDGSGEESHKKKAVDMGGLNWSYDTANNRFIASIADKTRKYVSRTEPMHCDSYTAITDGRSFDNVPDYSIYGAETGNVHVHDSNYTNATDFKNAVQGAKLVYELAEPTVTPLTAEQIAEFEKLRTFDGVTHVTCEAESEISYFRDSIGGKATAMIDNKVEQEKLRVESLDKRVTSLESRGFSLVTQLYFDYDSPVENVNAYNPEHDEYLLSVVVHDEVVNTITVLAIQMLTGDIKVYFHAEDSGEIGVYYVLMSKADAETGTVSFSTNYEGYVNVALFSR